MVDVASSLLGQCAIRGSKCGSKGFEEEEVKNKKIVKTDAQQQKKSK